MPQLAPEEKRKRLLKMGYDPDQYDLMPVEDYYAPKTPALTPSLAPQSTALGAAYRGAKRSLLPSLAGLGTTAALAAIPGLGPFAAVALPLLGGLGAGYGTGYLQEKIAPTTPEESAQRQADVKEHGAASVLGELIPGLLALKPSLGNVKGALTRLPFAGLSETSDAARAAILAQRLNVGLGAGLGALSEVGVPLIRGEDISPLRAASATIAGALLNEPNVIGRKVFRFHPSSSGALQPSLSPEIVPRVGYEGPIGPPAGPYHAEGIAMSRLAPQDSRLSRVYRQYYDGREVPPEVASAEPTVQAGESGVRPEDLNSIQTSEGVPIRPEVQTSTFEQRLHIERIEQQIGDAEAQIRHLPLQERLEKQAVLNDAKAKLAQEKQRMLDLQDQHDAILIANGQRPSEPQSIPLSSAIGEAQSKIFYVSPKGEVVRGPKPIPTGEQPPLTLMEMIQREQLAIQQKQRPPPPPPKPPTTTGTANAPNPKSQPTGNQPKHPGVQPRENVQPHQAKVRKEKGTKAGGSSGVLSGAAKLKPLPDDWRVTVQGDQVLPTGEKVPSGYVQFDKPNDGGSRGPKTITSEGFEAPDFSKLPTGQYTVAEAKKQLAVIHSGQRLALRSELGMTAQDVDRLFAAKTPFGRGVALLTALREKGILTKMMENTPKGHREALEAALSQAAQKVKEITGLDVSFKAGPGEGKGLMYQVESELAAVPLETLLQHSNNREVFDLLTKLGARAGIEQGIEPSLMTPQHEVALGLANIHQRVIKLNAALIAEDTQAHELSHILLRDMILQDDPMAMRGLALFGGNEERLVQALGTRVTDLAKMRVEGLTLKRFTEWVKDLVSAFKAKWANGSEEDFRRLLARRIMRGDYKPTHIVVTDPKEIAYQKLTNQQQKARDGLEAALAARTIAVDYGPPITRSVVDRVKLEASQKLGEAFQRTAEDITEFRGKLTNFATAGVESLPKLAQQEAMRYVDEMIDTKGRPAFQPSDVVLDWWEKSHREFYARAVDLAKVYGKKIMDADGPRDIHEVPYYTNQMLREEVQDVLRNKPNSDEAKKYRDAIIRYNMEKTGRTWEEAFADWESRGYAEHVTPNEGLLEYGPLSRPSGIGLPKEVREDDLLRLVTRAGNRYATALAWHKNIVADPEAAYLAGVMDQAGKPVPKPSTLPSDADRLGKVPIVEEAMKILKGDFSSSDRKFDAVSRATKSGMMQTLTGSVDLGSWYIQVLPYIHPSQVKILAEAYFHVPTGIAAGEAMGVIQRHALRQQSIIGQPGDMSGGSGVVNFFNGLSDLFNRYTGRDLLERVTRGLTMWSGQTLALSNVGHAFNPNASKGLRETAWRFLDRFAEKDWAKSLGDYVKAGQAVPDEIIDRIAARLVDAAQGTYDIRGLPLAALKGEVSPFLALAKWNIEKTNEFKKAVWNPLLKGNLTPFLLTTSGMFLGGTAIQMLREWMTRRKPSEATWAEIAEAGGQGLIYKAMALSSYVGYAGIATELAKQGMDLIAGRPVTGFRFPAVAAIANISERLSQAAFAINNGENMLDTASQFGLQLLRDNIQMARIGLNWTKDAEQVEKSNALRDLRTFRELHGLPTSRWSGGGKNPFTGPLERQYEQTWNPAEAVQLAGQLRQQAMERSGGDPERLRSLLNSYRSPSIDIMPAIRSNPQQFRKYLEWIRQTKGEQAAQQLLADYLAKERMDRMKMALLPSLSAR